MVVAACEKIRQQACVHVGMPAHTSMQKCQKMQYTLLQKERSLAEL